MSTRTREGIVQIPKLNFKISFFQDFYTLIEEMVNLGPKVGLPNGFLVERENLDLLKNLENPREFKLSYLKKKSSFKKEKAYNVLKAIKSKYLLYWLSHLFYLIRELIKLKIFNYDNFLKRVAIITGTEWHQSRIRIFLTLGYKDSGVYDRNINVIRLGVHQGKEYFTKYTLIHELIHFHIVKNMGLKLDPMKEEYLCRAIFANVFPNDSTATDHWIKYFKPEEIEEINKIRKGLPHENS
jgi:hypothetical protein